MIYHNLRIIMCHLVIILYIYRLGLDLFEKKSIKYATNIYTY